MPPYMLYEVCICADFDVFFSIFLAVLFWQMGSWYTWKVCIIGTDCNHVLVKAQGDSSNYFCYLGWVMEIRMMNGNLAVYYSLRRAKFCPVMLLSQLVQKVQHALLVWYSYLWCMGYSYIHLVCAIWILR